MHDTHGRRGVVWAPRDRRKDIGTGGLEQHAVLAVVLCAIAGGGLLGVLALLPRLAAVTAQL